MAKNAIIIYDNETNKDKIINIIIDTLDFMMSILIKMLLLILLLVIFILSNILVKIYI